MAHFYGKLFGKGKETSVSTRTGTPNSGMSAEVMGWNGRIEVHIGNYNGQDHYTIYLLNHPNQPEFNKLLARGVLDIAQHKEETNA